MKRLFCSMFAIAALIFTQTASAEPSDADRTFQQGLSLFDAGKISEACLKFAQSFAIDPAALGTLQNLAACHEREGNTTQALREWLDLASRAQRAGKTAQETLARQHALDLTPPPPSPAPPPPPPPPRTQPAPTERPRPRTGWLIGGAGLLFLGAGSYFGVSAIGHRQDSDAECPSGECSVRGIALNDRATSEAWGANIGIGLGLAAIGVSLYLLLSDSPKRMSQSSLRKLQLSF